MQQMEAKEAKEDMAGIQQEVGGMAGMEEIVALVMGAMGETVVMVARVVGMVVMVEIQNKFVFVE